MDAKDLAKDCMGKPLRSSAKTSAPFAFKFFLHLNAIRDQL
ncbi:MAG: hypothetical protein QOI77_2030 [Blastocatellia bacterium]|jgi:hypothetical protein|nr:hypothetical protein [Blastocatellia bacterium]